MPLPFAAVGKEGRKARGGSGKAALTPFHVVQRRAFSEPNEIVLVTGKERLKDACPRMCRAIPAGGAVCMNHQDTNGGPWAWRADHPQCRVPCRLLNTLPCTPSPLRGPLPSGDVTVTLRKGRVPLSSLILPPPARPWRKRQQEWGTVWTLLGPLRGRGG